MRLCTLVLALALLPAAAGAATTADRLREVEAERAKAQRQAVEFADQARLIEDRAQKSEAEARKLAAEVVEAESRLEAAQIRSRSARNRLAVLQDTLAEKRAPLSRMMAALQRLARRPTLLLIMRPASIRDFVRMRAMVAGLQPQIETRTTALRADLAAARDLAGEAARAKAQGQIASKDLAERRQALLATGAQDRITAKSLAQAAGTAQREATLRGAEARSIGALVAEEREGRITLSALAKLPSPTLLSAPAGKAAPTGSLPRLPVPGKVLAGFGERDAAGGRSRGLTIAPASGAPVVAPLAGEVAFSGRFRGYGTVVILRHAGGRTSLLAGLDRAVVARGAKVRRGETVGNARRENPRVLYELRQGRRAIHPLIP